MSEIPPQVESPAPPQPRLPFRLPADYYAAPPGDLKPIFPAWAPLGCGTAAALFLIVLFVGAAILTTYGMGMLMAFFLGEMESEMKPMYAPAVPAHRRVALEKELQTLQKNIETEKVPISRLDPVIKSMRKAIKDKSITVQEVDTLLGEFQKANRPAEVRPGQR